MTLLEERRAIARTIVPSTWESLLFCEFWVVRPARLDERASARAQSVRSGEQLLRKTRISKPFPLTISHLSNPPSPLKTKE
jgi:hypothetical protein